jgi:hypothetical protein
MLGDRSVRRGSHLQEDMLGPGGPVLSDIGRAAFTRSLSKSSLSFAQLGRRRANFAPDGLSAASSLPASRAFTLHVVFKNRNNAFLFLFIA